MREVKTGISRSLLSKLRSPCEKDKIAAFNGLKDIDINDENVIDIVNSPLLKTLVLSLKWSTPKIYFNSAAGVVRSIVLAVEALAQYHDGLKELENNRTLEKLEGLTFWPEQPTDHVEPDILASAIIYAQPHLVFHNIYSRFEEEEITLRLWALQKQQIEEDEEDCSKTYGEIDFVAFAEILWRVEGLVPNAPHANFVDLGSGTGKVVAAARLLCPWRSLLGIESSVFLHELARGRLQLLGEVGEPQLPPPQRGQRTVLENADMTDIDWSHGDLVFCHCTCFDNSLLREISRQAKLLKPGSLLISISHQLPSTHLKLIKSFKTKMAWGHSTVYVHCRRETGGEWGLNPRADLHDPHQLHPPTPPTLGGSPEETGQDMERGGGGGVQHPAHRDTRGPAGGSTGGSGDAGTKNKRRAARGQGEALSEPAVAMPKLRPPGDPSPRPYPYSQPFLSHAIVRSPPPSTRTPASASIHASRS